MVYVYVDLCALKIFMAQDFFDVNRVFCLVVFHRAFPVSEGVEVDLQYSWVAQFSCYSLSLEVEVGAHVVGKYEYAF